MQYDAIVIGGGPAGSTAAAVLATKGWRVGVLEKEKFPRYHIGESLLPYGYFTLERIGVLDRMKASHFTRKHSVQFVGASGRASVPFYFSQQLAHEASATWQVLRSEFDQLLLDNAREKGAEAIEEITARELIQPAGAVTGVKAIANDGAPREFHAHNQAFSFRVFITEFPQLKGDMTDCLIGNLFRDFRPLFDAVARFAAVPEPLPHGKPQATGEVLEPCR